MDNLKNKLSHEEIEIMIADVSASLAVDGMIVNDEEYDYNDLEKKLLGLKFATHEITSEECLQGKNEVE
jgi:hypothetical protein